MTEVEHTKLMELIAKVAHEANRAYCETIGDFSQPKWEDAPDWQKESARKGVFNCIINPGMTAKQNHDNWVNEKMRAGWCYGPVKDAVEKTHPCILPFEDLPPEQKAKDRLFLNIVSAFSGETDK